MSAGPATVPVSVRPVTVVPAGEVWQRSFRAMGSWIGLQLGPGTEDPHALFTEVSGLFASVEAQCTRFDPDSDLMRANRAGSQWCSVGQYCLDALVAAADAYRHAAGWFDPRVLRSLTALGYDRSQAFAAGDLQLTGSADGTALPTEPWLPRLDPAGGRVAVGPDPVDLGGIGQGLAVRWAAALLTGRSPAFCLDAGGDCHLGGSGPDGDGWHVGVEDPRGGEAPVAVLRLADTACATSSTRLRRWQVDGRTVHHLVDPRTGTSGGDGLLAVTVVAPDAADAEVWSKVLFLHGAARIGAAAAEHAIAALWIADDGTLTVSDRLAPSVVWTAS